MTVTETIKQMQLDCHKITQIVREIEDLLNVKLSDDEIDEWLESPVSFVEFLYFLITGINPINFKTTTLTEEHLSQMESKYGISRSTVENVIEKITEISKIDYFDYKVVNGFVIIHECEFKGYGLTNIVAKFNEKK